MTSGTGDHPVRKWVSFTETALGQEGTKVMERFFTSLFLLLRFREGNTTDRRVTVGQSFPKML